MKILRVDSAVTGAESVSRELTQAITDHFRALYPEADVAELDLAAAPLPHIDAVTTGAIRWPGERHDAAMRAAAPAERAVLEQFLAADIVVIGAPMYNFTIPSQLKAWLDRLGVPGVTFSYSEAGPQGLAGPKRVIVASSQGGAYELDARFEHHESLLRDFFGFIGIADPVFVRAGRIGFGADVREAALSAARETIATLEGPGARLAA
jgi:FMN-dependent NADH-azoreductase